MMSMPMPSPIDNLKIRLASVGDAVIETAAPEQMQKVFSPSDLRIQYAVSVVVNRPESRVDVIVSMSYALGQETLFSGHLTTSFDVVDLDAYIMTKEGAEEFHVEHDFFPMLVSIAFGTTRGYFVNELKGTVLAPYPFPMISMDNIQKRTSFRLV